MTPTGEKEPVFPMTYNHTRQLCLMLAFGLATTTAHAQPLQTTTTYTANLAGAQNCRATNLGVTRSIAHDGTTRTWISLTIRECANGSTDPWISPIVAQASQVIPDSDYVIGRTSETLTTTTSAGSVHVVWSTTADVHLTYSAQWTNDTRGTTTKQQDTSDTRSAVVSGTVVGTSVNGLTGTLGLATSGTSSK